MWIQPINEASLDSKIQIQPGYENW